MSACFETLPPGRRDGAPPQIGFTELESLRMSAPRQPAHSSKALDALRALEAVSNRVLSRSMLALTLAPALPHDRSGNLR